MYKLTILSDFIKSSCDVLSHSNAKMSLILMPDLMDFHSFLLKSFRFIDGSISHSS